MGNGIMKDLDGQVVGRTQWESDGGYLDKGDFYGVREKSGTREAPANPQG